MQDVFICYHPDDFVHAQWIQAQLASVRISCYMLPALVPDGMDVRRKAMQEIHRSRFFVLVFSGQTQTSDFVQEMLRFAIQYDRTVLPFWIEPCEMTESFDFLLSTKQQYKEYEDKNANLQRMIARMRLTSPRERRLRRLLAFFAAAGVVWLAIVFFADRLYALFSYDQLVAFSNIWEWSFFVCLFAFFLCSVLAFAKKIRMYAAGFFLILGTVAILTVVFASLFPHTVFSGSTLQYMCPMDVPRNGITLPTNITVIGDGACRDCRYGQLTIPDGVTAIGAQAFERSGAGIVYVADSVQTIGDAAFRDCRSLTFLQLPAHLEKINNSLCENCLQLSVFNIPKTVKTIGNKAFSGCSGLISLELPDSVTSVGAYAFQGCYGLERLKIGRGLTKIGYGALDGLFYIYEFEVDPENPAFTTDTDGALLSKDGTTLIRYPVILAQTSYTVPQTVTEILDFAFSNSSNLEEVVLPDGLQRIGENAFKDCLNLDLSSMKLPSGAAIVRTGQTEETN